MSTQPRIEIVISGGVVDGVATAGLPAGIDVVVVDRDNAREGDRDAARAVRRHEEAIAAGGLGYIY